MPWTWLIWELGVFLAALRLLRVVGVTRDTAPSGAEFFACVAAADIVVASTLATAFSFARVNHPAVYVGTAAVLIVVCLVRTGRFPTRGRNGIEPPQRPWLLAGLAALFVPLVIVAFRPVQEVDSLNYLHFLVEWMKNRLTPYDFGLNYVPFWELGFLPVLTLARSDLFFGLVALKSLVVLGGGLFALGLELAIPRRLVVVLVANVLAFQHFWGEYSGVATLKNDALHGAGPVLMGLALLRAVRRESGRREHVLMALGIAFACVKFSGPLLACFALAVYVFLARPKPRALGSILAFALAATGHYYVRNLIAHGNPLYPFQIPITGLRLPGVADLSYTSILHNLGDARLWKAFFLPEGGVSAAGVLFPATLAAVLIAAVWVTASGIARRNPRAWFAAFLLAGWLVYFRSIYSACAQPGDLAFIVNGLNSLRYVDGVLGMSELWLAALLLPFSSTAAYVAAAVSFASRLWLLYRQVPADLFPPLAVAVVCAGAGLVWLAVSYLRPRLLAAAIAVPLVIAAPFLTERNRAHWLESWAEFYRPLRHLPASSVFLVEDPRSGYAAGHFPLMGAQLQHEVLVAPEVEMPQRPPRFLVRLANANEQKPDFDAFASRYAGLGYEALVRGVNGVVLEQMGRIRSEPVMSGWLLGPGGRPLIGAPVEEGGAAVSPRSIRAGDLVAEAVSGRLFLLNPNGTAIVEPVPGMRLTLRNCGPVDASGRASGLTYVYDAGRWSADLHVAPALPPLQNQPFVSVSRGGARVENLRDADGSYQRIVADNDTEWLMFVRGFPRLPANSPVTIRARVRCPDQGKCLLAFAGPKPAETFVRAAGEWETLTITMRLARFDQGLAAAGRRSSRRGDAFDVRDFNLYSGFVPELGGPR